MDPGTDDDGAEFDPGGRPVRAAADALLARRQDPQWVSLSWVALRPLISSLNEVLCAAAPSLVPQLRSYWLTRVAPTGPELARSRHLDRRADSAFVVLGDTGEQDRSQYIVAPVLREVVERSGAGFAVVCSDVIYPSGDVNGYVHGLYLPYGPDPDDPGRDSRLQSLRLLAIPGNHDWHDGLAGFMQQFCGTGPLPREQIRWPGNVPDTRARWQDGLVRLLWRRPVGARPQRFWRRVPGGPDPVLADGLAASAARGVEEQRRLRGAPGNQPGSYFSVEIDGLLVVAIDTGVGLGDGDSAVDVDQGRWLVEVSRLPGPKVLLTGNPLLVNAQWKVCWIGGRPGAGQQDVDGYGTVNEVVADPAMGYVAAIGGDIHNFQASAQRVGPDEDHLVHYVVSGGGGAYMSATHPIPVVKARAAHTVAGDRADDADVAARNRRTGGAAVGTDGAAASRLVDGPIRLIPTPAESLAHFTRLVLPKLWRLERTLIVTLLGLAAGHVLTRLDGAHVGRDLFLLSAGIAALLVARAVVSKPLTRRLFRAADPRTDPLNRAYRAAFAVTAGLAGADVALAGAWIAGPSWPRHLTAWAALTAAAALVAAVLRYTGWWRPPVPRDLAGERRRLAVALGVWIIGLAVAAALGRLLPAGPRQWVPPAVVLAVGVLGRFLSWWFRPAEPTVGGAWARLAPRVSYLVQAVAALVVLSGAVYGHAWWLPLATALGVLALGGTVVVAFALAALAVRGAAGLGQPWQEGWGRFGGTAPWLTGALVTAALAGEFTLAVSSVPRPSVTAMLVVLWVVPLVAGAVVAGLARRVGTALGAALLGAGAVWLVAALGPATVAAYRQTVSTQLSLGGLLAVLLGVDALRRRLRGLRFTVAATAVAFAPLAVTWGLDVGTAWTLQAALVPVVGAALLLLTVVVAHLVFLGAQYLVIDRLAHHDRPDLLTLEEARTFLDWRSVESGPPPLDPVRMRRARMVFPTPDSPHGPIQAKVSEIFDSDFPPFFKNFLLLRTEPAPDRPGARRLRIDVHVVRGTGSVRAECVRDEPSIVIDLP
jgi:hypothetical protein